MKNYKIFSMIFMWIFGVITLCGFTFIALLWFYDPFWLFHKPLFRATTYHSDMRIQAKGIIDSAEFDSVILGSSMLENLSTKEAEEKLGGRWVNLSLHSSDFNERRVLLNYILKHKNIRKIIFSIDSYVLLNGDNSTISKRIDTKIYMDSFWYMHNKLKYYFNKKFIKCALRWSKKIECVGDKKDLEHITRNDYRSNKQHFGGFINWGSWQKDTTARQYKEYLENNEHPKTAHTKQLNFDKQKAYLQQTILTIIKENPQIEFYLIYPPYPRFFYAIFPPQEMYHYGRNGTEIFTEIKQILPYLAQEVANLENAKIYGLDNLDYADNIANYCDWAHHYLDMNSMQLDAIANSTNILTPQNIDSYLATMESKIRNYDIAPLIKEIKEWEVQSKK